MAELSGVLVEAGRQRAWRKSSHSEDGGACLEVLESFQIQVRDSKLIGLGHISFGVNAWTSFVAAISLPPFSRR